MPNSSNWTTTHCEPSATLDVGRRSSASSSACRPKDLPDAKRTSRLAPALRTSPSWRRSAPCLALPTCPATLAASCTCSASRDMRSCLPHLANLAQQARNPGCNISPRQTPCCSAARSSAWAISCAAWPKASPDRRQPASSRARLFNPGGVVRCTLPSTSSANCMRFGRPSGSSDRRTRNASEMGTLLGPAGRSKDATSCARSAVASSCKAACMCPARAGRWSSSTYCCFNPPRTADTVFNKL
mmetsp:Transcript_26737/g.50263  ORF Transcript_26737/g.50263 Transcript_26737/m.50263 type:complete len:243 (-) Transcript_26737:402-1130(-)